MSDLENRGLDRFSRRVRSGFLLCSKTTHLSIEMRATQNGLPLAGPRSNRAKFFKTEMESRPDARPGRWKMRTACRACGCVAERDSIGAEWGTKKLLFSDTYTYDIREIAPRMAAGLQTSGVSLSILTTQLIWADPRSSLL